MVVDFQGIKDGSYTYGITLLDVSGGNAPICVVCIAEDFGSWLSAKCSNFSAEKAE